MKNIKTLILEKYNDSSKYEHIENNIYKNLADGNYNITFSCEPEDGEDSQYPLEDILDKYYINCTGYFEEKNDGNAKLLIFELEGSLLDNEENFENIQRVSEIAGKRVYNKAIDNSIRLVIE